MPAARAETGAIAGSPAATEHSDTGARTWNRDHSVNVRISLPSPFGRFYLVVVGGRERRSAERRAQERRRHPLTTAGNLLFFLSCGIVAGLTALGLIQLLGRYLLQSAGLASF